VISDENAELEWLLRRAQDGDGDAFEALYRQLNRRVLSFAQARRAPDPEEIVNDVFLRVFTNIRSFEGNANQFVGWVFRIARNLIVDDIRKRSRRNVERPAGDSIALEGDDVTRTVYGQPADVESIVVRKDDAEALLSHLDQLTPEQRDVILLRVVADQSIEVTAATLGKSIASVKSIQYRATRRLAELLKESSSFARPSSTAARSEG